MAIPISDTIMGIRRITSNLNAKLLGVTQNGRAIGFFNSGRTGGGTNAPSGGTPTPYFMSLLASDSVNLSGFTGRGIDITLMTAFGNNGQTGTAHPSRPNGPGAGGPSIIKYVTTPVDSLLASYGNDPVSLTIPNDVSSPYWSIPGTTTVTASGGNSGRPGTPGGSFPAPVMTDLNNLFPNGYTFTAGSGGAGGSVGSGNQYSGPGGGGGAGGLNITELGGVITPIGPDTAAAAGGRGGSTTSHPPGEFSPQPDRVGGYGGSGGSGEYAAGGGGGGGGSQYVPAYGNGGSPGAGQGGITIIHLFQ